MSNQKIKLVPEATSLNFVYGRQNNDIVQVPTSGVSVGGLSLSISSSGLDVHQNRCSIYNGGYAICGSLCFVHIHICTSSDMSTLAGDEYHGMVDSFPAPRFNNKVPLTCVFATDSTNPCCQAMMSASGRLQISNENGIAPSCNYIISGFYAI